MRRVPLLPMLFGVLAAWSLLGMLAVGQEKLSDLRLFALAGVLGAAFAVFATRALSGPMRPRSKARWLAVGCGWAWLGFGFMAAVTVPIAMMMNTTVAFRDWPGMLSLVGFGGLGVLGGVMVMRFRRAEADRQQLALARELQERLLPPPLFEADGFRVTARNVPASYVAGDFYDFIPLAGGGVLIVIADVAGKGVAAGLMMATVKAILPLLVAEERDPAGVLRRVNDRLAQRASRRDFVAMIVAIYEPARGELSFANAGLPDPFLDVDIGAAPRALVVSGPRYPAGIRPSLAYQAMTVTLAAGRRVLFFTDGLPEAGVGGGQFGYDRLTTEVQRWRGDLDALFAQLDAARAAHDDDWTAVAIERLT